MEQNIKNKGIKRAKKRVATPESIFQNTQEALAYGERARKAQSLKAMEELLRKIPSIMLQYVVNINYNIQLFSEALHAFNNDEWYQQNKERPAY